MKQRRTLAEIAARYYEHPHLGGRSGDDTIFFGPDDGWGDLFRSREPDCMPHLLRYGMMRPAADWRLRLDPDGYRVTVQSECGEVLMWVEPLDPAVHLFCCRRCIEVRERYGGRTHHLVPDDGCSITGGRRGRRGAAPRSKVMHDDAQ
jgi:hypothetical protein